MSWRNFKNIPDRILYKRLVIYSLFVLTILSTFANVFTPVNNYFFSDNLFITLSGCIFIIICLLLIRLKPLFIGFNYIDLFILLYYIYIVVNITIFDENQFTANEFILFTFIIILYFTVKTFFVNEQQEFITATCLLVVSISILCMVPILIGITEYAGFLTKFDYNFILSGGFMKPGACANYMANLFPFIFAVLWLNYKKSKLIKALCIVTLVLAVIMLLVLNSRASWIACIVSVVYVLASDDKFFSFYKKVLSTKTRKTTFVGALVITTLFSSHFLYHYKKDSADGRAFIWKTCIQMIKDKPLLGHGFNTFIKTYNNYQVAYFEKHPDDEKDGLLAKEAVFALNDYLQSTTELGIIGLLLFAGIIIFTFRKKKIENIQQDNVHIFASKACILSALVCALFSYPFRSASSITIFFVFIAYVSAANKPVITINFSGKPIRFVSISVFILLLLGIEYHQVKTFRYSIKWKKAYIASEKKEYNKAFGYYKQIYPGLKNNFLFLFNYGSTKLNDGQYEEAIGILEPAKKWCTNYALYINLGDSYKNINNFNEAEKNYLYASNLIPHMFIPKYKLFTLYLKTNQSEKAYKMASVIYNMKIKVYSPEVGQIKNEILEYLKVNKTAIN